MASLILGVYPTVKGDGPSGMPNTQQLNLSNGIVVSFGSGGPPVPAGITASSLEVLFIGTDQTHVELFVPGNTSAQTLTLTDTSAQAATFDILESPNLPVFRTDPHFPHTVFIDSQAQLDPLSAHTLGGVDLSPFLNATATFLLDVVNTDVTFPSDTPTFTFTGRPVAAFAIGVPEPGSLLMWAAAAAGAVAFARRRLSRLPHRYRLPKGEVVLPACRQAACVGGEGRRLEWLARRLKGEALLAGFQVPQHQVVARGGQGAVGRERQPPHRRWVLARQRAGLGSSHVPDLDRPVPARGNQDAAPAGRVGLGSEGQGPDLPRVQEARLDLLRRLSARQLPQDHRAAAAVLGPRGQGFAVRGEGHGPDRPALGQRVTHLVPRVGVPEPHVAVEPRRGEAPAVG